jgi:hypothetical protein
VRGPRVMGDVGRAVGDPDYGAVRGALEALRTLGIRMYFTLRNLAEYRNVCTRPVERNGFGLTVSGGDRRARGIEQVFTGRAGSEQVYWE